MRSGSPGAQHVGAALRKLHCSSPPELPSLLWLTLAFQGARWVLGAWSCQPGPIAPASGWGTSSGRPHPGWGCLGGLPACPQSSLRAQGHCCSRHSHCSSHSLPRCATAEALSATQVDRPQPRLNQLRGPSARGQCILSPPAPA